MSSLMDLAQDAPLNAAEEEEPEVSFPHVKVRWMEPFAQDPPLRAGVNRDGKPGRTPRPKPYEYKTNEVGQYARREHGRGIRGAFGMCMLALRRQLSAHVAFHQGGNRLTAM
jgi:hypothetical protein